jgi:hypothetical protein
MYCCRTVLVTALLSRPLHKLQMTSWRSNLPHGFIPRAAPRPRPFQHLHMTSGSGSPTYGSIPMTTLLPRPLPIPFSNGSCTRRLILGASLRSRPLQLLQVTSLSNIHPLCVFVPGAAVFSRPLQHLHVTSFSTSFAIFFIPWAVLRSRPLQHHHVTSSRSMHADFVVNGAALLRRASQHLQMAPRNSSACPLIPITTSRPEPF